MNPRALSLFRERYKGAPNPMTPTAADYRMVACGRLAVELSHDVECHLWGVTVLRTADPSAHCELSKALPTRGDAEAYIETLRRLT
jgi:hypothetical protein